MLVSFYPCILLTYNSVIDCSSNILRNGPPYGSRHARGIQHGHLHEGTHPYPSPLVHTNR